MQIGQVSLDEILETWGVEDQKEKDSVSAFFKEKDISGDQKLSLAGEYQSTYGGFCFMQTDITRILHPRFLGRRPPGWLRIC